jgi:dipeptidyl aminopeptidase/acylaminoacyl peptidase
MEGEDEFGSWSSPITADRVIAASVRLGDIAVGADAGDALLWWDELRPQEDGRTQIVRQSTDGVDVDVLPAGFSANSRVHEYGGGSWWLHDDTLFFVNDDDQRVWRLQPGDVAPDPVSPAPDTPRGLRYADGVVTADAKWIVCVQEVHPGESTHPGDRDEAVNRLIALGVDSGEIEPLFQSSDFVAWPRLSPGDGFVSFLTWDHPDMPWDSTGLWVAGFESGDAPHLVDAECVAGQRSESICQPQWDSNGRLWFISDRTDWWNLYRFSNSGRPAGDPIQVDGRPVEVGQPEWVFGHPRYAFTADGRVVFGSTAHGSDSLGVVDPIEPRVDRLDVAVTSVASVAAGRSAGFFVGATFVSEPSIESVLLGRDGAVGGQTTIRPAREMGLSSAYISEPQHISFPTSDGAARAHALFYPPSNPQGSAPPGDRPPLLVMIHGGPTSSARPELKLGVQYWTSRGFAVADVNYRGSTGYGRNFRDELKGNWGRSDVEDCVAAADFLAAAGRVDRDRLLIRGGSAGGFTALAALTFTDAFAAGASLYGVADLAVLAADTHKFESRYLDSLVGPWPEAAEVYRERSPIHHVDRLDRPVIILQGLEDKVVPPNQAELIVDALAARGVPHAYVTFDDEGHGFRKAPNIKRALEAELSFYLQILEIPHPDDLPVVEIRRG